jgi:hypothetical protein
MKVTKVTGRGTGIRTTDVSAQNWAGDEYRKTQQEKLAKIGKNVTLALGRGNKSIPFKDLTAPKSRPSTEGMVRITNRGTGARRSTNKGN